MAKIRFGALKSWATELTVNMQLSLVRTWAVQQLERIRRRDGYIATVQHD